MMENKLNKPKWIRIKIPAHYNNVQNLKLILRNNKLNTVCEEASCPNIVECFNRGIATFMILGVLCTRKCPFCDVKHGRPLFVDSNEPQRLAKTINELKLKHVVLTSVNRDDLKDGGAMHFSECIKEIRQYNKSIIIEILVPDFRGRMDIAINSLNNSLPDVFNHNIENVPRLYNIIRPGSNYKLSLKLLRLFKENNPNIETKSGLMMGLGETFSEIIEVMKDLRDNYVTMLTLGQYLQPSPKHLPVVRYIPLIEFKKIEKIAIDMGFTHAICGPFVRSSYYADLQFHKKICSTI